MAIGTLSIPHFDEIEKHPDDALTAYSYFAPSEAVMTKLVDVAEKDAPAVGVGGFACGMVMENR